MKVKRNLRFIPIFAVAALLFAGGLFYLRRQAQKPPVYSEGRFLMGTEVSVELREPDPEKARLAANEAFEVLKHVEKLMNVHDPESEISRLNREAHARSIEVDPLVFSVLKDARYAWEISGGAFDVTVGPLLNVWKRHSEQGLSPPSPEELQEVLGLIGTGLVELEEPDRVRFNKQGVEIDLGGIAKGFAADLAIAALKARGIKAGLVNAGGDISLFGGTMQEPWRVGIQDPFAEGKLLPCVALLQEGTIVTSGNYRRGYSIGTRHYSHIVDPRTGAAAEGVASVTVIAASGSLADALATAISVIGSEKGLELAGTLKDVDCLVVTGSDKPEIRMTAGFKRYLVWQESRGGKGSFAE